MKKILLPINNGWDGLVEVEVNDRMEAVVDKNLNGKYVEVRGPGCGGWQQSLVEGEKIRITLCGTKNIEEFNKWAKNLPEMTTPHYSYFVEVWDNEDQCWY